MPDESSLVGKGRDLLLPKHGNPFKKDDAPEPPPQGTPPMADEPAELSPADLAARFPSAHGDRNQLPGVTPAAEVRDLSPNDLANLLKATPTPTAPAPAMTPSSIPASVPETTSPESTSSLRSATEDPNHQIFENSWLKAAPQITATGHEEALPADDAHDVIPLEGLLATPKPAPKPAIPTEPAKDPFMSLFPNLKDDPTKAPASVAASATVPPVTPVASTPPVAPVAPTSSGLRLPSLASAPSSSSSSIVSSPAPVTPATPAPTLSPSPMTPAPAPLPESKPAAPAAPSLADRLPSKSDAPATPAKPADAPKPPDVGFKPANPFATAKPSTPPMPEVAKDPSPDADDDDKNVLVGYSAGSSPSQPSRATSMSRVSTLSPYSDPFSSTSSGPVLGGSLPTPPVQEQDEMVKLLVTDDRLQQLWKRIDDVENRAINDNNLGPKERTAAMDNIRGARNLLLGGRMNYEDALRYVVEVEADLMQVNRLRSWSMTYGMLLFIYNMAWLAGLAALWANVSVIAGAFQGGKNDPTFFITILCGGLGGVTGALRSMWVHIAKDRDFDPQHMWWYIINPILGCVLAIFGYWTVQLGLIAVNGSGATGSGAFVLYVLGWLVGFQQNVAYQLVEQAIKMFFKREESKPAASGASGGDATKPAGAGPDAKPSK